MVKLGNMKFVEVVKKWFLFEVEANRDELGPDLTRDELAKHLQRNLKDKSFLHFLLGNFNMREAGPFYRKHKQMKDKEFAFEVMLAMILTEPDLQEDIERILDLKLKNYNNKIEVSSCGILL